MTISRPVALFFNATFLTVLCSHLACTRGAGQAEVDAPSAADSANLPDFELETLGGQSVRLSDYLGKKVILIDFWATFCDPCLAAFPHLNQLYKKYEDQGFVILAVSVDGPESVSNVRAIAHRQHLEFPVLLDQESSVVSLYNPKSSAPFSILINRQGEIVKQKEGFTPTDLPALEAAIQSALLPSSKGVK